MTTVKDIYDYIDTLAPFSTQLPFDNAGFLVGDGSKAVERIGFCLDITNEAVEKAADSGVDLIVSHHPVIFNKLGTVKAGSVVFNLIEKGIGAICAHTNYDSCIGGVNDCLFDLLGLSAKQPLYCKEFPDAPALGRVGMLPTPMSIYEFAKMVKLKLNSPDVRYTSNCNRIIEKVAVCGGAGSDLMHEAISLGADALLTSEVKNHEWFEANDLSFAILDAGHFSTESIAIKPLYQRIAERFEVECVLISQNAPYKTI